MEGIDAHYELRRFSTCDVSDALDVLGHMNQAAMGVRRMWDGCPSIAGRVLPILLGPEEKGSTVTGTLEAIEAAEPGDVLVFDNGGRLDINTFGSIAAFCSARAGIAGTVIDGATRDIDDLIAQSFPTYAKGVSTTTVRGRTGMAGFGIAVQCSGVEVNPGDYVIADGSGVVFIPQQLIKDVIRLAPRFQAYEREIRKRIINGGGFVEVHKQLKYEDFEGRVLDQ